VARQPAIDIGVFLVVAFQTHSHLPVFERQALQIFNLTVAFQAGDLFVYMALVVEQYMFCHIVYFHPGCRGLGVEIFVFFLDLGMFFNNIIMAVQALFHRRDARKI